MSGFRRAHALLREALARAIAGACERGRIAASDEDVAGAARKLLDRIAVIRVCESCREPLIAPGTLVRIFAEPVGVYARLQVLFAGLGGLPGPGGRLFAHDPILDVIELPDALAGHELRVGDRTIRGYGLLEFDFIDEVDEHQLGHAFEDSRERKRGGVFYTTQILSDYLAASALAGLVAERSAASLRILDPACGAGAFLLSARQRLCGQPRPAQLFGADLLSPAVELAELSLWLRSIREAERSEPPTRLIAADSLEIEGLFEGLEVEPGSFDLVLGNPPWGAEVDARRYRDACAALGLPADAGLDVWELFVALGLHALRPGGRLAMVLPDTLFSPDKALTRGRLLEQTRIEKLHNLGPDWFGPNVRMGTVVIQARLGKPEPDNCYSALVLHGERRHQAIAGQLSLAGLEAEQSRRIPQARSRAPEHAIEVFRDRRDDRLMQRMDAASEPLARVCERARGEEMAKSGLVWRCPDCATLVNPGAKAKGGGFKPTNCRRCNQILREDEVEIVHLVSTNPVGDCVPFIDGDALNGRYKPIRVERWLRLDTGFRLKPAGLYAGPKILLRQAGVGVAATLDDSDARCPQSVYVYRVDATHVDWTNEYVLAALLSRIMAYYVFKRFAEVDPDRAHAKLTHERLAGLPIPRLDLHNPRHAQLRAQVRADVRALVSGKASVGGSEDWRIELALHELYGLVPDDWAYIESELKSLPPSQALTELFPLDHSSASNSAIDST